MRQRPHRNTVHARPSDLGDGFQRNSTGGFQQNPAGLAGLVTHRHRLPQLGGGHVIQQNDIHRQGQRTGQLDERINFQFHKPLWRQCGANGGKRTHQVANGVTRARPLQRREVIILHQHCIIEPHPVIAPPTDADGIFLKQAVARSRLSSVYHRRGCTLCRPNILACNGGDPRQPLEEVERHSLGGEHRPGGTCPLGKSLTRRQERPFSLEDLRFNGAVGTGDGLQKCPSAKDDLFTRDEPGDCPSAFRQQIAGHVARAQILRLGQGKQRVEIVAFSLSRLVHGPMIESRRNNTTPPGFFVTIMKQLWVIWGLLLLAGPAVALDIVPTFVNGEGEDEQWTDVRRAVVLQAIADWEAVIGNDETIEVTFHLQHETTNGWFAMWYISGEDIVVARGESLRPWHPDVDHGVIVNLAMPVWFDPTPGTNDDLEAWDALTAIRHEMGHMLGHRHAVYYNTQGDQRSDPWAERIVDGVFDPDGLAVPMANMSHTAEGLMSPSIYPLTRYGVQETAEMLYVAYGYLRPDDATSDDNEAQDAAAHGDYMGDAAPDPTPDEPILIRGRLETSDQLRLARPMAIQPVRWILIAIVGLLVIVAGIAHRLHRPHSKSPFRR